MSGAERNASEPQADGENGEAIVRASVRAFMSSDVDVATYVSRDRRNDAVWLRMLVGPAGESGEESFDLLVCTPLWLADDAAARDRPRIGRHLLIAEELDLRVACNFLRTTVESVVGDDWNAIGERIARIGYWEFEDYQPWRTEAIDRAAPQAPIVMRYPSPANLERAPVWENYVIAQAVEASRGHIPEHTLAFGVEVQGAHIQLRFQLSALTIEDEEDMSDIVSLLEALVGNDVAVTSSHEVLH